MTFKQCVTFCLQAPVAAWENMNGRYYAVNVADHLMGLLAALFNTGVGVLLLLSGPLLAPGLYFYLRATASKRAEREAARQRAMDADF